MSNQPPTNTTTTGSKPAAPVFPPRSRARENPLTTEEVSTTLQLGEFQHVPTLSLSEANLLIGAVIDHRKKLGIPFAETETLVSMQDYLAVFSRFKVKESIEAVERLVSGTGGLEGFERSQLSTLSCETADEAKTLIPSLANKISDVELQELLDEISKLRAFVE